MTMVLVVKFLLKAIKCVKEPSLLLSSCSIRDPYSKGTHFSTFCALFAGLCVCSHVLFLAAVCEAIQESKNPFQTLAVGGPHRE